MTTLAWGKNSGVIIDGADAKNSKVIREMIEENLKDSSDLNQLQNVVSLIYNLGQFNDVEVYFDEKGDKTEVIFKVYPLRIIRKVQILGNSAFSNFDLGNELAI